MTTADIYLTLDPQSLHNGETIGCLQASAATCKELATRLLVSDVAAYSFDYKVKPSSLAKDAWIVSGYVYGTVIQSCCVTSEPVSNSINEHFQCICGDAATLHMLEQRGLISDNEDPPEPLTDERLIPIGELGVQHFALGIPLYPRLAGASWPEEKQ
jgi:uncharacterized protein